MIMNERKPNQETHLQRSSPQISPDGKIGKASRRRSRASRKAPTTLFNTDTSNFRAMVQQFTGAPSSSSSSSSLLEFPEMNSALVGPTNMSFGLEGRPQISSSMAQAQELQQSYSQNQGSLFFFNGQEGDVQRGGFIGPRGGYSFGDMNVDNFPSR